MWALAPAGKVPSQSWHRLAHSVPDLVSVCVHFGQLCPAVFATLVTLQVAHPNLHPCTHPLPSPPTPLQVSALAGQLHSPLLDPGVDLLRGHVCQGHGAGEGGSSEGDSQDDGPAGRHLLAELVHYQPHTTRHQFYASRPHPQGDHIAALESVQ